MAQSSFTLEIAGEDSVIENLLSLCARNYGRRPPLPDSPSANEDQRPVKIDYVKRALLRFLRESAEAEAIRDAQEQARVLAVEAMTAAADSITSTLTSSS